MQKKVPKRVAALLMTVLILFGSVSSALADTTIGTLSATNYFEHNDSGNWIDLKTPQHWDRTTGDVAYCLAHDKDSPPSSANYAEFDPDVLLSPTVQRGIQAIVEHGYPSSTGGFSADEARYATANAIRIYLRETAGVGYDFMLLSRGLLRSKSGYQPLYDWMLDLVQHGRNGDASTGGSIKATPSTQQWQVSGNQVTATMQVTLTGLSDYEIASKPSWLTISGFTGKSGDTLTLTAPDTYKTSPATIDFASTSGAGNVQLYWYETSGNYQPIVTVEKTTMGGGVKGTANIIADTSTPVPTPTPTPTHDIEVIKVDENGAPLTAQFSLTGPGGSFSFSAGQYTVRGVQEGSYTLTEVQAPDGYVGSGSQNISLYGGNQRVTIVNRITSLEFQKTDAYTGAGMANVEFRIKSASGSAVRLTQVSSGVYQVSSSGNDTFRTDSNGKAVIKGLPLGSYIIEETDAPAGYASTSPKNVSITTSNTSNSPASAAMTNEPLMLEFSKTDSYASAALDGATFRLLDGSGNTVRLQQTAPGEYKPSTSGSDTFTTSGGKAVIRYIPAGTYTIEEETAPTGFMPDKPQRVTVTASNGISNPVRVSMKDEPLTLEFQKKDSLSGTALDGGTYRLVDSSGRVMSLAQTSPGEYKAGAGGSTTFSTSGGRAVIRYLPAGNYRVEEVTPPSGFMADQPKDVSITLQNGASNPAQIAMTDEPLTLEFTKTDSFTQKLLDGASFRLVDASGSTVKLTKLSEGKYKVDPAGSDTFTTSGGKAVVYYVPAGSYTVKETKPPAGFAPALDKTVTVLDANGMSNPAALSMQDEPLTLVIQKLDALNGQPVANVSVNATFKLLTEDGKVVKVSPIQGKPGFFKPDEKGSETFTVNNGVGSATILYLPYAVYQVAEVTPPTGYAVTAATVTVTVRQKDGLSNPAHTDFKDQPLMFELLKKDKLTNQPMANAKFRLKDEKGATVNLVRQNDGTYKPSPEKGDEFFVTSAGGKAIVMYLPVGKYTVEEAEAPAGYTLAAPASITMTDKNDPANPLKLELTDEPTGFIIAKTDASNGQSMKDVHFRLKSSDGAILKMALVNGVWKPDKNGSDTFITDANGKAVLQYIPLGKYTLEEIQPGGYITLAPISLEITNTTTYLKPFDFGVKNTPTGLSILKTDAQTGLPMVNVSFRIKDEKGNVVKTVKVNEAYRADKNGNDTFTTDASGKAAVWMLPLGKYTLEEVTPSGYAAIEPVPFEITISCTYIKPLELVIKNNPLALHILKVADNKPLDGAGFAIKKQADLSPLRFTKQSNGWYKVDPNGVVTDILVDAKGEATVIGIPAGEYQLEETIVPEGYFAAAPKMFTVTDADTYAKPHVEKVVNKPLVKLGNDSDRWRVPVAIGLIVLVLGLGVFLFIRWRRR